VGSGSVLQVDGSTGGSAVLTSDGSLVGSGTIGGAATVSGTLSPSGSASAQLTFSDTLLLGSSAVTSLEIIPGVGGPGSNTSISAQSLTYGGQLVVTISALLNTDMAPWALFQAGATGGDFSGVRLAGSYSANLVNTAGTWTGTSGGYTWSFSEDSGMLTASLVPEPDAWTLALLGLAAVGLWGLRKKRVPELR